MSAAAPGGEGMVEAVPVIPLEYAKPDEGHGRWRAWRRVNRITLVAGAVTSLLGGSVLHFKVESVLFSGPVLMVIGVAMLLGGVFRQKPIILGLGVAHCAVCVLFVALVNLLHWGPQQAAPSFEVLAAAYNLLTLPAAVWAWVRRAG